MTTAAGRHLVGTTARSRSTVAKSPTARVPLWALLSSALLPIVLVTAWVIAGSRQPATYSPVRQTVSVLSGEGGADRWIVTAALYAVGLAYLVTAFGLRTLIPSARVGLVIAGFAGIGLASFPQPAHGTNEAHAFCTGVGAIVIAVWPALAALQEPVLGAVGVRLTVVAITVSVAMFVWMAIEIQHGPMLGLAERMSSGLQSCWPFVVTFALWRSQRLPDSADR